MADQTTPDSTGLTHTLVTTAGRRAERHLAQAVRWARARRGPPIVTEALTLRSTAGYRISAWVHRPANRDGALPAVVLCPGIDDGAEVFVRHRAPVDADEIARLGCAAVRFDPAGRGQSWGDEDFGGEEHQDDVACLMRHLATRPDIDADRIGVLAISLGVAMAVGAIANEDAPAAWLIDWEGPCDREIITAGGRRMAPAMGYAMDDDDYWVPREAVRHVGRLGCPYVRIQGLRDHAQPGELRHARRMTLAAQAGEPPWFQLNDHPRNELPPRPLWVGPGTLRAHDAIMRKVKALIQ